MEKRKTNGVKHTLHASSLPNKYLVALGVGVVDNRLSEAVNLRLIGSGLIFITICDK